MHELNYLNQKDMTATFPQLSWARNFETPKEPNCSVLQ